MADDLVIESLRGGLVDTDPPTTLAADQCTVAENVEFFVTPVGERRRGCTTVTIDSTLNTEDAVVFLHRHLPTADDFDAELWAASATIASAVKFAYKDTSWHAVTLTDAIATDTASVYGIIARSLHGKLFVAYNSGEDRLHVRDVGATNIRPAGLAEPAAPTGADTGAGTYAPIIRYYRVRMTFQSGGVTTRRSEFSDALTATPSGSGTAYRVTKPTTIEDATHWELEASADNSNFYRIATTAVGTTTYDDSAAPNTYATTGTLSEDTGDYSLIWSAKYLAVDQDRLLFLGSWEDDALASRVGWTPVGNDPGVGNDERIPTDTDNTLDLDNLEGGVGTGLSEPVLGAVYAFKQGRIYKLVRTGNRAAAYDPICISTVRGAIPGSVVMGVDENGRGCVYFLDYNVGPARIGVGGLQFHRGIAETWKRVNPDADITARGLFYPDSQQVRWSVAVDDADTPNLGLVLQTNEVRDTPEGLQRGWSLFTGTMISAYAMCLFSENINDNTDRSRVLRPFVGLADPDFIQRCDTEDTDNGDSFTARIVSHPFISPAGILSRFGGLVGGLVGKADADAVVRVSLIRDFGVELASNVSVDVPMAPTGTEDPVIKEIDDLSIADCRAIQIEITDPDPATAVRWELHQFVEKPSNEESS